MRIITRVGIGLSIACIIAISVVGVRFWFGSLRIMSREFSMGISLRIIGDSLRPCFEEPAKCRPLSELGLSSSNLRDVMSGKPFVFVPAVIAGSNCFAFSQSTYIRPIVWQPEPYRTKLWLFGEERQFALFSDLQVRNLTTVYSSNSLVNYVYRRRGQLR